eukprot:CAMPEP_0174260918 /NCGR_PEP_ID=MMETSP0439-20130205/10997_1 /TAXON_ID=0 /ORGANISM="Stereomyxa ramosa, Strain Chinc5" /LENGTH=181 /DNA_ID=CAMNT_0015345297 /DNA_START=68 /DNA_END=616 /DNA_ORIENTATION=-
MEEDDLETMLYGGEEGLNLMDYIPLGEFGESDNESAADDPEAESSVIRAQVLDEYKPKENNSAHEFWTNSIFGKSIKRTPSYLFKAAKIVGAPNNFSDGEDYDEEKVVRWSKGNKKRKRRKEEKREKLLNPVADSEQPPPKKKRKKKTTKGKKKAKKVKNNSKKGKKNTKKGKKKKKTKKN